MLSLTPTDGSNTCGEHVPATRSKHHSSSLPHNMYDPASQPLNLHERRLGRWPTVLSVV
ncbi:hypothetical protein BDW60DRAFT_195639, partial [Aspergillus nidulans var. acristatus]